MASEAKFTPGPWKAHRTDWMGEPSSHHIYISGDEHVVYDDDDEDAESETIAATAVAIVQGNATSQGVTDANAALIAAAPDLFDACQAALDRLDYLQNLWSKEGITDGLAATLRAAIASARPPEGRR